MSGKTGMGRQTALRLEYGIIGLGVLALVMIFQPFSLTVFAVGSGLVVLAGLANNLLPLCRAEVPLASVGKVALLVAFIFLVVMALAILSAWAYGELFVKL